MNAMMRPFHRNYIASWSSRRETAGLMGAFLVFLLGFPSHSDTLVNSTRHLIRQLINLVLVFLGLSTPTARTPATVVNPPVTPKVVVHTVRPADPNSMLLRSDPHLHRFVYVFKGVATLKGQPCPKASVLVCLLAGDNTVAKGAVTEEDGSYSVEIAIDAADQAPMDWTMEAYTPDFKKVELSGRQIVQREEEEDKQPITVTNPVEFTVSRSK